MKATINQSGILTICPESELESFALINWVQQEDNIIAKSKIEIKSFTKKEKKNDKGNK